MLRFPFFKIAISNLLTATPFKYSNLCRNRHIVGQPSAIGLVDRMLFPFVGETPFRLKNNDRKSNMGINGKRVSQLQQNSLAALLYIENMTHDKMQPRSKSAFDATTYFPSQGLFQNLRMSSWTLGNIQESCHISCHKANGGFWTRGKI